MKKLRAAVFFVAVLGSVPRRRHEDAGREVLRSHVRRDDRLSSGHGEEGGGLDPAAVGRPVSGDRRREGPGSCPVHPRNGLGGKPARALRPRQARAVRERPRGQGHVSRHEARSRGARSGQREGGRASRRGGASEAEPARAAHAPREGPRRAPCRRERPTSSRRRGPSTTISSTTARTTRRRRAGARETRSGSAT